ncbi:MAG: FHA domain-containing protein [Acidimicrobiales bacterium]
MSGGTATVVVAQEGRRPLRVVVDGRLDVGRECDGLLLADERVSRLHLRLDVVDERIVVSDLGSSNGTFLDGTRLDAPSVLSPGSTICLGSTSIRLATNGHPPNHAEPSRLTLVGTADGRRPPLRPVEAGGWRTGIDVVASAVARERALLERMGDDGDDTVTILFSDIEGSTERAVSLGDERWYELLRSHNRRVSTAIGAGGGRVVKQQGDGHLATFPSARRAVLTAARIQQDLTRHPLGNEGQRLRIRIGCHTGEVITDDDGDLFGRHVIIAARVADLAAGDEVLVSSIAHDITSPRGDLPYGDPRIVTLRGMTGTQTVHPLDWRAVDGAGPAGSPHRAPPPLPRSARR